MFQKYQRQNRLTGEIAPNMGALVDRIGELVDVWGINSVKEAVDLWCRVYKVEGRRNRKG
jgi:hypothetical protein